MESKSNIILWRSFLALSLFTIYSLILTLNYNSPQIMQFVAHHHYKEIETGFNQQRNNYSCIAYSCIEPIQGVYAKNRSECYSRHYTESDYYYELDGKKYYVSRYAYTGGTFNCLKGGYVKAYYFPLIPSWSVLNNRPLKQDEIRELKASLERFSYVLYALLVLAVICFYKLKPFEFSRMFRSDLRISSLIIAIGLPFIVTALVMSQSDFQAVKWLIRGPFDSIEGLIRLLLMIVLYYAASIAILLRNFLNQQKHKYLWVPIFIVGHIFITLLVRIFANFTYV